jgi:hypothetical protein
MAFTSTIVGKMQGSPMQQGLRDAYRTEWVIVEWDGTAVTTGEIDLECDEVLVALGVDNAAVQAIQIKKNADNAGAQPGWLDLDFTSGSAGVILALVMHRR